MNHRIKLRVVRGVVVLLVVLLCLYIVIPNSIIERFTLTEDYDDLRSKLQPVPHKFSQKELKSVLDQQPQNKMSVVNMDVKDLPQSVIDGVKIFVSFLGHPRSGHSIVASLMDSHPHMVISHEFNLFGSLSNRSLTPTKSKIFNALWENTITSTVNNGSRTELESKKGYTLFVDGLYQGKYVDHIDVIGDKKGVSTTGMLLKKPDEWLYCFNIVKSLAGTLKVIHVIRNPYDNIATMILFTTISAKHFVRLKASNNTSKISSKIDSTTIENNIKKYFSMFKAIADARKRYKLDIIEIHGKDLISNPRGILLKMCNDLRVTCSDNYLEICSNKIYKTESKTRYMIQWTNDQLQEIQQNIEKFSSLRGYSFDS